MPIWNSYTRLCALISILYAAPAKFRIGPSPEGSRRKPGIVVAVEPHAVLLRSQGAYMLDVILLVGGLGFFAIAIAYAFGCERL